MRDRTSRPNAHGPYATEPRSDRAGGGPTTRHLQRRARSAPPPQATAPAAPITPGPTAADRAWGDVFTIHVPVQRAGDGSTCLDDNDQVHALAAAGVAGAGQPLPHRERIAASFGPGHDLSHIRAAVGGPAAEAANAIGATAYATGDRVAFADAPDLHTAAHEAAHVVQQGAGVHLSGGVGRSGDPYEQHADAVADRVVSGQSAADLLPGTHPNGVNPTVQRKDRTTSDTGNLAVDLIRLSPEASALINASTDLVMAKHKAQNAVTKWRADGDTAWAAKSVIAALGAAAPALMRVVGAHQRVVRQAADPLRRLGVGPAAPGADDLTSTFERLRPEIHDSLTNLARTYLTLKEGVEAGRRATAGLTLGAGLPPNTDDLVALASLDGVLLPLVSMGAQIGWQAPKTVADANVARFQFEACPLDLAGERPEACGLTPMERVTLRDRVRDELREASLDFRDAIAPHREMLAQMVKSGREAQKLVLGTVIEVITTAIDVAAPGTGTAAKLAIKLSEKAASMGGEAAIADSRVPGSRTDAMLASLVGQLDSLVDFAVDQIEKLDDPTLEALARRGRLSALRFQPKLDHLVRSYQQQVDPLGIGLSRADAEAVGPGIYKSAWIEHGPRRKLAQVRLNPGLKGIEEPDRYAFIRWIDPVVQSLVEDSQTLPSSRVDMLPMPFLAGVDAP